MNADTVDFSRGTDPSALREQHARGTMAAQKARRMGGLAIARLLVGIAAPLGGVRIEVVVGRFDDG